MKKGLKTVLISTITLSAALSLTACKTKKKKPSETGGGSGDASETQKIDITGVVFNNASFDYDGQVHSLHATNLPNGVSVTYVNNNQTNAGSYVVKAKLSGNGYNPLELEATLTIGKASISGITFTNQTVAYDGNSHSLEINGTLPQGVSVKYFLNDQEFTGANNVGEYNVTAKFTSTNQNYTAPADMTAKLTITSQAITGVTFGNKNVTYNGQKQTIAISGNLPEGVSVKYFVGETEFDGAIDAGVYTVVAKFTTANPNITVQDMTATLTIAKADITGILFNNKTEEFNGEAHSVSILGTLPDGITVSYQNNNKVNAGEYNVIAKFEGSNPNYNTPADMTATLIVSKKKVAIKSFSGVTVTYGNNSGFRYRLNEGQVLPEGVTIKYSYQNELTDTFEKTDAGSYNVSLVMVDENNNHEFDKEYNATLKIEKANIEGLIFNGGSINYDGDTHMVEVQGQLPTGVSVLYLVDGQEFTGASAAGTYEITAHFVSTNNNYNTPENMTVTLVISATATGASFAGDSATYDGSNHTIAITGINLDSYDVEYTCNDQEFTGAVNAGTYNVTAKIKTKGTETVVETLSASLVIEKANVENVTFENATATYDGTNKAIEITGTLPEGMTVTYLVNEAEVTQLTEAGTYEVVASFNYTGANYNVPENMTATLVINKAVVDGISFDDKTIKFDGQEHSLEITGQLPAGVTVSYSSNNSLKNYVHADGYSSVVVTASFSVNGNYEAIEDMTATLKVEKSADVHQITYVKPDSTIVYGYVEDGQQVDYTPSIANKVGYTYSWSGARKEAGSFVFDNVQDDIYTEGTYEHIEYTIEYHLGAENATNDSSNVASYFIDSEAIVFAAPKRAGYTFGGWYDSSTFTGEAITGITQTEENPITGDKDLYAKWTANEYTITLVVDGTAWHTVTVSFDDTFVIEDIIKANYLTDYNTLTNPTINGGKIFSGWFVDFDGADYSNEANYSNPVADSFKWNDTNDTTYYGYTKESSPSTVTFHLGNIVLGKNKTPYNTGVKTRLPQAITSSEFDSSKFVDLYDSALLDEAELANYFIKEWRTIDGTPYGNVNTEQAWEYTNGDVDLFAVLAYIETGDEIEVTSGVFKGVKNGYNPKTLIIPSYICDGSKSSFTAITTVGDGENPISIGASTNTILVGQGVTSIAAGAFENAVVNKTDVLVTSGLTTIGASAFKGCTGINHVYYFGTIENWFEIAFMNDKANPFVDSTQENRGIVMFNYTTNEFHNPSEGETDPESPLFEKEDIVLVSEDITKISSYAQIGNLRIKSLDLSGCTNLTEIGAYAFAACTNLEEVILPESLRTIGSHAFDGCTKLSSIDLKNVTTVEEYAFYGAGLETLVIPETLTQLKSYVFKNNTKLTTVTLPLETTSILTETFKGCTSLTTVNYEGTVGDWLNMYNNIKNSNILDNIENFYVNNDEEVTSLDLSTFEGTSIGAEIQSFKYVTSVTLPATLTTINDGAFENFTNLETIDLSNVTTIGSHAFNGCTSLEEITFVEGQTYGEAAFAGCTSLSEVDLKSNVGDKMFEGCTILEEANFANTVTSIGKEAFKGCTSLDEIFAPSVTSVGFGAFANGTSDLSTNVTGLTLATSVGNANVGDDKLFAYMFGEATNNNVLIDTFIFNVNGQGKDITYIEDLADLDRESWDIELCNCTIKTGALVNGYFNTIRLFNVRVEDGAFDGTFAMDLYIMGTLELEANGFVGFDAYISTSLTAYECVDRDDMINDRIIADTDADYNGTCALDIVADTYYIFK